MKTKRTLLFLVGFMLLFRISILPATDSLRILLITGGIPVRYHKTLVPTSLYSVFQQQEDFQWDHASLDEAAFENDIRDDYDVIVFFNRSDSMSPSAIKHVRDFIESGKGVVILHSALSSYTDWDWWWRGVVGGKYQIADTPETPKSGASQGETISFRIVADHPITEAVGSFSLEDETYNGLSIQPGVRILYRTDNPTSDGPVVWIGPHKTSRVVVIQPGHFKETYLNPHFRSLLVNAILWAGKRKTRNTQGKDYKMQKTDIDAIKGIVEKAYIQGIHGNQDEKVVKTGFHRDFDMLVKEKGRIRKVDVDEWLAFIENTAKVQQPDLWKSKASYDFQVVDVTEDCAFVKIDVHKGTKHFSTDFMLLYRFDEGWKIVSKIFILW